MTTAAPETIETDVPVEQPDGQPQQIHRSQLPYKMRAVIAEQNADKLDQQAGFLTQRNFELALEVEDLREQLANATAALAQAEEGLREAAVGLAAAAARESDDDSGDGEDEVESD